ncbi:putative HTH-type transcriptional regulator Rv0377 [Arthrobacter sp. Bi26]|uniref:LysR family transcriptional regulator n=1 Tax=Arthrobacter sp. Bi26 TaxID=2822350 RepID=UPI001DE1159B|nr:LysR family transcriptional regulator [Arthrobacter sp. Bi26]CAH0131849.1 putative HTH-type transcriptional regulator Rv0377 [Arthrobacter sp. Bi26]
MTLGQLRTFALVAKLGSLHAAAVHLGVSEPAVSTALAALRQDLGDPLFVRAHGGIALTPGGRALAEHAQDIVGLADQARWEVAHAQTETGRLNIVATAPFAEHAAGRLLDLFTRRVPGASVDVVVEEAEDIASLMRERVYDIALGARPAVRNGGLPNSTGDLGIDSAPFLRYQRIVVAAAGHPLAALHGPVALAELLRRPWFAGPAGVQAASEEGRWLASQAVAPEIVRLSSETEALAAVRAGEGTMLALGHIVRAEIRSGALVRVPVAGTPVSGLWWASTLDRRRATTMARTLQRFAGTADATAAMVAPGGSRGLERRGSKFHVALWS